MTLSPACQHTTAPSGRFACGDDHATEEHQLLHSTYFKSFGASWAEVFGGGLIRRQPVAWWEKMAYPVHDDLGNVDARDSFSDLGQSFTSRTADDWADCANSEDWGSPPSPCGGTLQDEEKTAGPEGLVADGAP